MTKQPKAGFSGSFRAPLGPYQVQVMHAIDALGDDAYGGRIEALSGRAGFKSNRGEVYGATTRMTERGFLDEKTAPHPTRGGRYTVTVYTITKAAAKHSPCRSACMTARTSSHRKSSDADERSTTGDGPGSVAGTAARGDHAACARGTAARKFCSMLPTSLAAVARSRVSPCAPIAVYVVK